MSIVKNLKLIATGKGFAVIISPVYPNNFFYQTFFLIINMPMLFTNIAPWFPNLLNPDD